MDFYAPSIEDPKGIMEQLLCACVCEHAAIIKIYDLDLCPTFDIVTKFNPLYSDGFSHTYRYNKYGIAHCVFKGSQVEFSKL